MAENSTKNLKVTLVRSPIRSRGKAKDTLLSLGLRKMHQSHILPDNEAVRGMIFAVKDMVICEETDEPLPSKE
jgi:large subunit ribosomal protein L30